MRIRNLWAIATLCGGVAALSSAQAEGIHVNKWPDDVPCSAIKKNPDGSYTLLQTVFFGSDTTYPMRSGNTFSPTSEYRNWVVKCG